MKNVGILLLFVLVFYSCKESKDQAITAQDIVDKAIEVSGGNLYYTSSISFTFRDRSYSSEPLAGQKILRRILKNDTIHILDVKTPDEFKRYINDSLVILTDSMANVYANSVNSVHYFAYLPYGLNDQAVKKELVGEIEIENKAYYKIQVSFSEEGGGDDFEDVFLYWFNKETFVPDYLAYKFKVNGGGMRFRQAYNERFVGGIRFVDYVNLSPLEDTPFMKIDSLFIRQKLKELSKIELEHVVVEQNP